MACSQYTLRGIARGCKDSIGGIKTLYLTTDIDDISPVIDSSVLTLTQTEVSKFKTFNFFKNTGSMTTTLQTAENAGNSFQTEVSLVFMKQEARKRLEIEAMVMGETIAVVEDVNGEMWYLGKDNALTASAATAQTGTAAGDLNGYNVTLMDESRELPFPLDSSTKAAFKGLPATV